MATEVVMPQLGQAMVSGVVIAWHVKEGEEVCAGALLLTIESDKSAFEIEAPATGMLRQIVAEGAEADVGVVLATIGAGEREPASPPVADDAGHKTSQGGEARSAIPPSASSQIMASPKARAAAAAGHIDLAEVAASRADGIISATDVEQAIKARDATQTKPGGAATERRQPIGAGHRSAIRRLQASWSGAPHIVQMVDVDATQLVAAQKHIRAGSLSATINDIIIKAAADTMAEFDDLNAYIAGDEIVYSSQVDVSIAVATDRGLRTPVLRSVAGLPLEEVAARTRAAIENVKTARDGGGRASLTISNLGRYNIRCGTPVLNLDEAVLVFVGAITERPAVVDGMVVPRHEMTLSIAYDHRIADGLRAAEFSNGLRRRLEMLDLPPSHDEESGGVAEGGRSVRLTSANGLRCDLKDGRGHGWVIDEPALLGGSDSGPDPVTSLLAALLSCLTISFRLAAKRRNILIDRIEGAIKAEPEGKVGAVTARLEIWTDAPPDKVRALLKPAKNACYVHDMLRSDLELKLDLEIHAAQGAGRAK